MHVFYKRLRVKYIDVYGLWSFCGFDVLYLILIRTACKTKKATNCCTFVTCLLSSEVQTVVNSAFVRISRSPLTRSIAVVTN